MQHKQPSPTAYRSLSAAIRQTRTIPKKHLLSTGLLVAFLLFSLLVYLFWANYSSELRNQTVTQAYTDLDTKNTKLTLTLGELNSIVASLSSELTELKNRDEYQINIEQEKELTDIKRTYSQAVLTYEQLIKLKDLGAKTDELDKQFTSALLDLSDRKYAQASQTLNTLSNAIGNETAKLTQSFTIPASVPTNNTAPAAGSYNRQRVSLDIGDYLVDVIAADLSSTHVYVDTASESTCANDCPVLPLATYVSRNGAFAGINGSYFCPASYPSCSGKTNSFDTLLMNRNKVYFNSDNNVYSTVPAVIFGNGWVRFVGQSLEWGRDTGIDSMIANQPLLVSGGNVVFGGDGDPKKGSVGARSFVASRGNTVYIGVVHNATVAGSARVLAAMGMEYALNLDSGGSTALWNSGYKIGPGRNIPNAILFVRK